MRLDHPQNLPEIDLAIARAEAALPKLQQAVAERRAALLDTRRAEGLLREAEAGLDRLRLRRERRRALDAAAGAARPRDRGAR